MFIEAWLGGTDSVALACISYKVEFGLLDNLVHQFNLTSLQ